MPANYKIWGGLVSCPRKGPFEDCTQIQHRAIVQATSQKRAVEILVEHHSKMHTIYSFRTYWSLTGNKIEKRVAVGNGEGLWIAIVGDTSSRKFDDYVRIA